MQVYTERELTLCTDLFPDLDKNLADILTTVTSLQTMKGHQSCFGHQMPICVPDNVVRHNCKVRV
jgi:hypothetical protein